MTDILFDSYGMITANDAGIVIEIDKGALNMIKLDRNDQVIGKNIVTFLPDYSIEDLYLKNLNYNVQILYSENLLACSLYEVIEKKVYIKLLIFKISRFHHFFQKIVSGEMSEETKYFLSRVFSEDEKHKTAKGKIDHDGIVGSSELMQELFSIIEQTAETDATLLLTGETGVGKSMFAKVIHNSSHRKDQPFIEINCATIHENLIESELFGYAEGAFTGAKSSGKVGKIELAHGGTLFLDEITEMPLDMQQKFLQVIQNKSFNRVGGNEAIKSDFRLITATNRNLEEYVEKKEFRQDLYYRINVIPINIPPLRNRESDIILFILFFVRKSNEKYNKSKSFSKEAIQLLCHYSWPGNVRELENVVERSVLTSKDDVIQEKELPLFIQNSTQKLNEDSMSLRSMMEDYERRIILDAYSKYKTSVKVGEKLGLSQTGAAMKIRKYIKDRA